MRNIANDSTRFFSLLSCCLLKHHDDDDDDGFAAESSDRRRPLKESKLLFLYGSLFLSFARHEKLAKRRFAHSSRRS